MHVLIIPSWYPDAPGDANGSFFREQAIALASSGKKVGVIYPNLRSLKKIVRGLTEPRGTTFENDDGVLTYRLQAFNWTPRLPFGIHRQWISQGMKLFEDYVSAQGLPDVIHAHSMLFAGALAVAIKRRYRIPVVVTEHSSRYAREELSAYEFRCAEQIVDATDKTLAVSEELASLLNKQLPKSSTEWQTLPNIVHRQFLSRELKPKTSGRGFMFVNVALLNKIKQHANLIRAFAEAFKFETDVSLTIAGDGPERGALQALIEELQLETRVTLLGNIERNKVPELLAKADAFVLSSAYETFGVVIAEALAMGVPVVSTACGGPNSIVTGLDGLLVDVDSNERLGLAMRKLRDHIADFDPEGIRTRCLARFGEASIVDRLTSIYRELSVRENAAH